MSEATKTRRVTFSFGDVSHEDLSKMVKQGGFTGMEKPQNSFIHHHLCFPKPEPTGEKEIIVRNPETGEERIIVVPTFEPKD
jgi:hypothetical protein